jgi:2-polyprenyl-3-methyl-5-hydroxy-6-metoxy-1,4-benzoquinol methylase
MLAVIEHIEDTDNILKGIKSILKPNGRLFISVTNRGYHADASDIHVFSKESLRLILERYYTILKIYIKANTIFVECHV